MALPPNFLDELRARTPLPAVIGRRVRLVRAGRQWKGCCPFHGEKTPSFHVYEDHYHCFGCGEHGDAIAFVMKSQGAAFMEAVEQLAAEAGLEVPKPSPAAAEAERRRLDLHAVLDAAALACQRRLFLPEGARALDYLRGRGLTDDTIRRFGLGWSGEGRGALAAELSREGIDPPLLAEAGLIRPAEDGRPAADLFFNRVMFPIRDRRGRTISFGGRSLGDGQPKYVNGPETALFSKRRTLFALEFAREAVRQGGPLIVVEGYMDAISLHQAGFGGAVAPLGTALTGEQFDEIWRVADMPVLCFDGDKAGRQATLRSIALALPRLTPAQSLKVAYLPDGQDPDSFVRSQGPAALQFRLDQAESLWSALYVALRDQIGTGTVEERLRLREKLDECAKSITNRALAAEARAELFNIYFEHRRSRFGRGTPIRSAPPADEFAAVGPRFERARHVTAIALNHLQLFDQIEEAWAALPLPEAFDHIRREVRVWIDEGGTLDSASLIAHLRASGLGPDVDQVLSDRPLPLSSTAQLSTMPADAIRAWWYYFGLIEGVDRLEAEKAMAVRRLSERWDPESERRLVAITEACNRLHEGAFEE